MRLDYRRTYSQFVDNYLATYFSSGVQLARRLLGGPALIILGTVLLNNLAATDFSAFIRIALQVVGYLFIFIGAGYALLPAFNIFLVWLRREQFFGADGVKVTLRLYKTKLRIMENGEEVVIPLDNIISVQRRAKSAWVLTKPDHMIYIPSEGLTTGDYDEFVDALDEAIKKDEED